MTAQEFSDLSNRLLIASKMGFQYGGKRKVYEALGYPTEQELDFKYYFGKYSRQDIAAAVIDRPADRTWNGTINIVEEGQTAEESALNKAWQNLNKDLKVKSRLKKADKLAGIGRYSILLFGFSDVKSTEDWAKPLAGNNNKLRFIKQVNEFDAKVQSLEKNTSKERFGLPLTYQIRTSSVTDEIETTQTVLVHWSRVLHIKEDSLDSEIYGRPRLKPIINRLVDLEKVLGGDAEMFWRGARPGYHAAAKDGYELGQTDLDNLYKELDNWEHDLRRFIAATGVDIKALETQISNPLNHVDVQLQAISAQTGIPKRILIGSERGELASSQDKDAFLSLIKDRMEEYVEPEILRPFIDYCMATGVLPKVEEYEIMWEDVFAPSEKDKVEVGKTRAEALKAYNESVFASEIIPPQLVHKILLGLDDAQSAELTQAIEDAVVVEDNDDDDDVIDPTTNKKVKLTRTKHN